MAKSVLAHIQKLREVFHDDSMQEEHQQVLPTASLLLSHALCNGRAMICAVSNVRIVGKDI